MDQCFTFVKKESKRLPEKICTPDTVVQDPTMVQNLNRYSYVINNPLSYTDPSGHFFKHALKEIGRGITSAGRAIANPGKFLVDQTVKSYQVSTDPRYLRLAASVAISVVATAYCPYGASAAWYQTAAYYGAVGYTSTYVATNGDKKAALTGAISGAVFNGIGSYFSYVQGSGQLSSGMMAAKVAAHGVVGGLSARANGGKFESGFLSAGLSQAAGQYGLYDSLGAVENAQGWNIAYNAGVSAVVGGSISEMTGGSFEEGALTAAMGRLYNDLAHSLNPISVRENIDRTAWKYKGSHAWDQEATKEPFGPGDYKCNLFVSDVLAEVGVPVPNMAGNRLYSYFGIGEASYPPTAAQWHNPDVSISGWKVVAYPEPGDIVSSGGHMGFIVSLENTLYGIPRIGITQIGANPGAGVRDLQWGVSVGDFTYRRYVGK